MTGHQNSVQGALKVYPEANSADRDMFLRDGSLRLRRGRSTVAAVLRSLRCNQQWGRHHLPLITHRPTARPVFVPMTRRRMADRQWGGKAAPGGTTDSQKGYSWTIGRAKSE